MPPHNFPLLLSIEGTKIKIKKHRLRSVLLSKEGGTGVKKEENSAVRLPDCEPLLAWYRSNARDLPWRHTRDPYRIWVSEIMLQQTRVEAVIPYYHRFLSALPNVAALADAPEEQLLKLWEGLGYYSRVRNMQKAAKSIMSQYGGVFPQEYEQILSLCGVGEYTAGAIGSFAFDLAVPAVDGNVLRVAARLGACGEDILAPATKRKLTAAVAAVQPSAHAAEFNQAMIELGATVCLPNGVPKCDICPLRDGCAAYAEGLVDVLPVRRAAAPRRKEEKTVVILRAGDCVALRRRPANGLLAGLFEPLCLAGKLTPEQMRAHLAAAGITPLYLSPLEEAKHIFTHIEWHMVGYEVILQTEIAPAVLEMPRADPKSASEPCFFAPREEIDEKYAVPTAFRAYRPYM